MRAWIRQFLRVPRGYPEWMVRGDLTMIPGEWKSQCAYLGVKGAVVRKDYAMAYMVASVLLNIGPKRDALSAFPAYERIVCAHTCHEFGRREEGKTCRAESVNLTERFV